MRDTHHHDWWTNKWTNEWMNGFPNEHTSMSLHPPAMNTPDTLTMVAARKSIIAPAIPCVLMMMVVLAHFSRVLRSRPEWLSVIHKVVMICFSRGASEQSRTGQDRIGQDRTGLTARWTFSCWPFASFMSLILISKKSVFSVISSKERRPLHTRDCERDGDGERRRRRETKRREREREEAVSREDSQGDEDMDPTLVVKNKHNSMKSDNFIRWDRKEITFWTQSWKVNDN